MVSSGKGVHTFSTVCVYYCRTYYKAVRGGGEWTGFGSCRLSTSGKPARTVTKTRNSSQVCGRLWNLNAPCKAPRKARLTLCQGGSCTGLFLSTARPRRTQAMRFTTATTGTRTPARMGACMCAMGMRQCTALCVRAQVGVRVHDCAYYACSLCTLLTPRMCPQLLIGVPRILGLLLGPVRHCCQPTCGSARVRC